jgi:hypothetical protein
MSAQIAQPWDSSGNFLAAEVEIARGSNAHRGQLLPFSHGSGTKNLINHFA